MPPFIEGYDEAVRYPQSMEDFAADVGANLDMDYHDATQGWSDPCGQFCPACKGQCNGRDQDRHPSPPIPPEGGYYYEGLHGCGRHIWRNGDKAVFTMTHDGVLLREGNPAQIGLTG